MRLRVVSLVVVVIAEAVVRADASMLVQMAVGFAA
jgi:hypothetical protein